MIKSIIYSTLLLGMLCAVATHFACRRPAFWECAVTISTVRLTSLEPADHLVAAACNPTFAGTAAVLATETPGLRGSGAFRHGALWLLLSTAVCAAMLEPVCCVRGATSKLALTTCTMLETETACIRKGDAAFRLAHCIVVVIAMPPAVSFFIGGSRIAAVESAEPIRTMFLAETTSENRCITPIG